MDKSRLLEVLSYLDRRFVAIETIAESQTMRNALRIQVADARGVISGYIKEAELC